MDGAAASVTVGHRLRREGADAKSPPAILFIDSARLSLQLLNSSENSISGEPSSLLHRVNTSVYSQTRKKRENKRQRHSSKSGHTWAPNQSRPSLFEFTLVMPFLNIP